MALILAIEPDPQQAALLSDLVRTRVRSDLVLADTTEHALVAIADRVPDLVLIPALMSAQEDAALAGALRMIAAAARVEMVTIPFLAAPVPAPEPKGVLAKWRKKKTDAPVLGCDPAVFADQIAAYLPEREEEQGSGTGDQGSVVVETVEPTLDMAVEPTLENAAPEPIVANPIEVPAPRSSFALIDWQAVPAPEPVVPEVLVVDEDLGEKAAELARREEELRLREEAWIARLAMPVIEETPAIVEPPPPPVVIPQVMATEPEIVVIATELDDDSVYELSFDELESAEEIVSTMAPLVIPQAPVVRPQAPTLERLADADDPLFFCDPEPVAVALAPAPVEAMAPKPARPEWAELIDSLRHDIERLKTERAAPAHSSIVDYSTPAPSRAALNAASAAHSTVNIQSHKVKIAKPGTRKTARPVQDEWGLFDPEQCGFASLLAKLSEITDANDNGSRSREMH